MNGIEANHRLRIAEIEQEMEALITENRRKLERLHTWQVRLAWFSGVCFVVAAIFFVIGRVIR